MCEMCDGATPEQFVADVVADIRKAGWSIVAVEDERGRHVHSYTVGLTRVHGHAELVFSGGDVDTAHRVLDELAAAVCEGRRLVAGETLARREAGCECLVVQVANPERLVIAQAVCRLPDLPPVPALQIVWADEGGRWPWQMCDHHRRGQEVLGPPPVSRG